VIDRDRARELAEQYLREQMAAGGGPVALMDEHTQEEDFGWVFFYNAQRFIETRDRMDALAGNGPIAVDRVSGEVTTFWSGRSVEESIRLHREERNRAQIIAADAILSALARRGELDVTRPHRDRIEWRFASVDAERDEAIARLVATFRGSVAWAARRDDDGVWTLAPARWFMGREKSDLPADDREKLAALIAG
jgi:hypothetical protein